MVVQNRPALMCAAGVASAFALVAMAGPAIAAHKPYLLPFAFGPDRDYVGVEGAMVEDNYFVPDFAMRGSGDWQVTGPDGVMTPLKQTSLKSISVADVALPAEGTYRISTGDRPGRIAKLVNVDGIWRPVRPAPPPGAAPAPPAPPRPAGDRPAEAGRDSGPIDAAAVPPNAETVETQSFLLAETYVSRGVPSLGALKARGKGFELEPITHPNEIFVDEGFAFRLLIDGAPAADVTATVYRGEEVYDGGRTILEARTDAAGKATVKFPKAGIYMLNIRYPEAGSPGGAPTTRSWTYTLTVEVTQ